MNTNITTVRLFAIAAAAAALVAPTASFASAADATSPQSVLVNGISVPVAHLGPGAGSVKTAPYIWFSAAPAAPMAFHITDDSSANAAVKHLGPGIGSVKSPAVR